jgi:predicted transcriptional regulator
MTRILADLPDDDIKWLDRLAEQQGKSRAAVLREAVSAYKDQPRDDTSWIDEGFGLWARHGIAVDPREYERHRRAEWTRPWDDDYEEVRNESPDLFDEQDDRERQIHLDMLRGKYPDVKRPARK